MPAIRGITSVNPDTLVDGLWIILQDGRIFGTTNAERVGRTGTQLAALINTRIGLTIVAKVDPLTGFVGIYEGTSKAIRV
mgnify:CR=1 FL=1